MVFRCLSCGRFFFVLLCRRFFSVLCCRCCFCCCVAAASAVGARVAGCCCCRRCSWVLRVPSSPMRNSSAGATKDPRRTAPFWWSWSTEGLHERQISIPTCASTSIHGGRRDGERHRFPAMLHRRACASTPSATFGCWTTCTCHIAWRAMAQKRRAGGGRKTRHRHTPAGAPRRFGRSAKSSS